MTADTRREFVKKSLLTAGMIPPAFQAAGQGPEDLGNFRSDVTSPPYPWTNLNFHNEPRNFRFAILPDLTGRERPGVFVEAVKKLNMLQPEFVISIGDVIEGHSNDKAKLNSDWNLFLEHVAPLEMPFFYLAGNHDYWYGTVQGPDGRPIVYDMREVYEQHAGPPYYHFLYHNVLFLILQNTVSERTIDSTSKTFDNKGSHAVASDFYAKQKQYVTEVLTQNQDVRWTFVFIHYPTFFNWPLADHITSLLGDRPYITFGGNSHEYVYYNRGGREYINVATVGGMSRMRGVRHGELDHFLWVTMRDDGPRLANLTLDGILPKTLRTESSAKRTDELLRESPLSTPILFQARGHFQSLTTKIRLVNSSERELKIRGSFQPHDT
jgi:hypothetical protein